MVGSAKHKQLARNLLFVLGLKPINSQVVKGVTFNKPLSQKLFVVWTSGSAEFSRIARSGVNLPVAVRLAELVAIASSPLPVCSVWSSLVTCGVLVKSSGCKGEQNLA